MFLSLLWLSCGSRCLPQLFLEPEGKTTERIGVIRLVHDHDPSGLEEDRKHDSQVSYWALEVQVPVNVQCTPEKPQWAATDCRSAKPLKLFFAGDELMTLGNLPAAKWKDKRVIVQGQLHRTDTAGEMTPIYMDVEKIDRQRLQRTTTQ